MRRFWSVGAPCGVRQLLIGLAAAGLFGASPAAARFLPDPAEIGTPGDRKLVDEALSQLTVPGQATPAEALATLDRALTQLSEPSESRGIIQFLRAGLLSERDQDVAAREAIDESVRLLPGYSGPLLTAATLYSYSDQPTLAADYLLRATEIDPEMTRRFEEYDLNNILQRLSVLMEARRIKMLSERLLAIGWRGEGLGSRSRLALNAIEARVEEGDVAGARGLIPKLLLPRHSRDLLMQSKFRELWPDLERWAGSKLEKQWSVYLREARDRWQASKDPATALDYAIALEEANHNDTMIREMLPLFSSLDPQDDYDLIFVAAKLAEALARKGRWDDIEKMFESGARAWPLGGHANALNIAANRARFAFYRGKAVEALAGIDAAIADSARWREQVNRGGLAAMHYYRACILHKLGRTEDAALSRTIVGQVHGPASLARLFLCLDKPETARQVLISALADEVKRAEVLGFVQKDSAPAIRSDYGGWLDARFEEMRTDPQLLSKVAKYGRVLPFSLSEGAPLEAQVP